MNLVVSVSGGETSGFMVNLLFSKLYELFTSKFDSVNLVFANTSQEREETLVFIKKLEKMIGHQITWLESKVNHNDRKSCDYTVVDFDTASRNGEPFIEVIKKYGIPNPAYLHCTRDLKNEPIKQWCIDKFGKDYVIAIGIRLDEQSRKPKDSSYYQTIYPLIDYGYTKQDVIEFWGKQDFRLEIENYQGNCKWCWKKAFNKLWLIAHEDRSIFDFPIEMERLYGLAGENKDGTKRVFFRGNKSAKEVLEEHDEMITDEQVYKHERERVIFQYENSMGSVGCSDECAPFTQESLFK